MNKLKVATVFSGIGSIEFALKRLNIQNEIVFACDNGGIILEANIAEEQKKVFKMKNFKQKKEYVDLLYSKTKKTNYVKKTFLANYEINDDRFYQDIRLLDGKDFANSVDLFVGGSPCQSFSIVGEQKGLIDERGNLFFDFLRLVKTIQPKVFIYENVRGLYTHDNKRTWSIIFDRFNKLKGYKITHKILNSLNFGIPQNRSRLFVIGVKSDKSFSFPDPIELTYKLSDFLEDTCRYGSFISNQLDGSVIINKIPGIVDTINVLSPRVKKYVLAGGTKGFYQKPDIDLQIARPLLATMGNKHRAGIDNYITVDENRIRMLSPREAHRLMGFTDDFNIVVSRAQAYKQAGNSIVVDIFIYLILELISQKILTLY